MPRLSRLRFVSIGHPQARMDDLTLDFRDRDGRATDSTLWLRNGGGKSSILNLFFALLRPRKNEFLGGKADSKKRSLGDYVLADDRAVVVAEWQLDGRVGELALEPQTLLTGVFHERRPSTRKLERLYFCTRVASGHAETDIEKLPLMVDRGGVTTRRTMASFRQIWRELRAWAPELQAAETEVQSEWRRTLESAGLDPDLFAYQVRMNMREGGADELFRFAGPEEFVDFLLRVTVDPSLADKVGRNIGTFRRELLHRKQQLVPEAEFVEGTCERLGPLAELLEERQTVRAELAATGMYLHALKVWLDQRRAQHSSALEVAEEQLRVAQNQAEERTLESAEERRRASLLRWHAARMRLRKLRDERERVDGEWRAARYQAQLWTAAVPLAEALQCERKAAEVRVQLQWREREHKPLRVELGQVAIRLHAALSHQANERRAQANQHLEDEREARDEAREYQKLAADAKGRQGACQAEARHVRGQLDRAETQRQHLVAEGVLDVAESAQTAAVRWRGAVESAEAALARLDDELGQLESRLDGLNEQVSGVREEFGRERAAATSLQAELERAEAEAEALRANPILPEALQLERRDLDLDRLDDRASAILERLAHKQQEAVVDYRLAQASDERDALHIEEEGLLPADPEVVRLREVLSAHLGAAWSGWRWIAENSGSGEAGYEAVRRAPEVARGIVVRPQDLDAAEALLCTQRKSGATSEAAGRVAGPPPGVPRHPVVLATHSAFERQRAPDVRVIGPSERGYFDRDVAQARLRELRTSLSESEDKIRRARQRHKSLSECRASLTAFRERYPLGFFATKRAELVAVEARRDDLGHRRQVIQSEIQAAQQRRQRCQKERGQGERDLARTRTMLERVRRHHEEYEARLEEWRRELDGYEREIENVAREIRESQELAEGAEERAMLAARACRTCGEDARAIEEEAQDLHYVDEAELEPQPGNLAELRQRYRDRRALYEERIGAEGLLALADERERNAKEFHRKFRALLPEGITEDEVRAALVDLDENASVEEVRIQMETRQATSRGRLGNIAQQQEHAEKALHRAVDGCRRVHVSGLPELPAALDDDDPEWLEHERMPSEPVLAEQRADDCERAAESADTLASEARERAEQAKKRAEQARRSESDLGRYDEQLDSLQESYSDLLAHGHPPEDEAADTALTLEDGAVSRQLRKHGQALRGHRERWDRMDRDRMRLAQTVRAFADEQRFDTLDSGLARRFRTCGDEPLETDSAHFIAQLSLRLEQVRAQLADADRQRRVLIDEVLSVARDGLTLLTQADAQSRLPEHLPGLGGARFLRIATKTPEHPDEQRGRLGQLVDELARDGADVNGITLMQKAVRRLIRPVRVRILHPDPALDRRSVDISEMARFSGGEQLTGAILLYCTLARVRAYRRGLTRKPESVLILDNPIGRASRMRFLEMQREVARAMGVQLVYTTAINDYDALSALPNVIRLRNQRVDRNRGHRLIEPAAAGDSDRLPGSSGPQIQAVRLARGPRMQPVVEP